MSRIRVRRETCATITTRAGALTRNSKAGSNTIAFSGRIGRTTVSPAKYQATITARVRKGPDLKAALSHVHTPRG